MRKALERIAIHFEGCDLDDDPSCMYVVREAADALGWRVDKDEYNQIKYDRGCHVDNR